MISENAARRDIPPLDPRSHNRTRGNVDSLPVINSFDIIAANLPDVDEIFFKFTIEELVEPQIYDENMNSMR
eukprot:IDg19315t1